MKKETKTKKKTSDTFKILAIDGGGIKGLYSAIIIQELEKKYGPMADYFDLIAGTSTGAIIGTALCKGVPGTNIVDFYKKNGPVILPSGTPIGRIFRLIKQIVFTSKFSNKKLRSHLTSLLGDTKIDESKTCLCISCVDLNTFRGFTFRTSHNGEKTYGHIKLLDAVLATTAAPSYLPIVEVPGVSNNLVDGCLWANNPTQMGLADALKYYVGPDKPYKKVSILSVGNIDYNDGWWSGKPRRSSMLLWNKTLISLALNTQTKWTEKFMQYLADNKHLYIKDFVRIANTGATSAFKKQIELDRADPMAMREIEKLANEDIEFWRNQTTLKSFFKEKQNGWKFPVKNVKKA